MDKAKSLVDNKGASGPLHVNNVQSPRGLNGLVVVAANGSCSGSNAFGLSTGPSSSTPEMHHLQRGEEECNGSPAKRCRLRRRTESVKRNRPRKLQKIESLLQSVIYCHCSDIIVTGLIMAQKAGCIFVLHCAVSQL
ncbi:hypothetical protein ILYODFUR_028983 [Ilyodon furcidens]|uniref:Uncharacterized protein n=1 Tax=Ilyodon furcidens TaxID=33524 RepID=A0ABV0V6Z1_9TELE